MGESEGWRRAVGSKYAVLRRLPGYGLRTGCMQRLWNRGVCERRAFHDGMGAAWGCIHWLNWSGGIEMGTGAGRRKCTEMNAWAASLQRSGGLEVQVRCGGE